MNIGILGKSLDYSQHSNELILNANQLVDKHHVVYFYEHQGGYPIEPIFGMMPMVYAYQFDGVLISNDIESTLWMNALIGKAKKLFYVYDLEWLYKPLPFRDFVSAYEMKNVDLIARSESHAELIGRVWKKPKYIVENYNYEQINDIIGCL